MCKHDISSHFEPMTRVRANVDTDINAYIYTYIYIYIYPARPLPASPLARPPVRVFPPN